MKTYWEKLKDPRWQKKRLEVMDDAGFACEACEATDKTLNVHHKIYRKKAEPWEYSREELSCLCEGCHERWHNSKHRLNEAIAKMDSVDLEQMVGYAEGKLLFQNHELFQSTRLLSYYDAAGMSDAVCYSPMGAEEVLDKRDESGCVTVLDVNNVYWARRERAQK